jgi:hypothetical protein
VTILVLGTISGRFQGDRLYGRLSAEVEVWTGQLGNLVSRKFEHHAAAFVR